MITQKEFSEAHVNALRTILRTLLFLFLMGPLSLFGGFNNGGDTGIWLEQNMGVSISPKVNAFLQTQERWANDAKTYFATLLEGTLYYTLYETKEKNALKFISFGAGYNAKEELNSPRHSNLQWVWTSRYLLLSNIIFNLDKWELVKTLRFDYRVPHHKYLMKHSIFRYRVRINSPWKFSCYKFNPFFSNEWFFRENTYQISTKKGLVGNWHQNRFRTGLNGEFMSGSLLTTIYLQWRAVKQAPGSARAWNNTFQLGFAFTYLL